MDELTIHFRSIRATPMINAFILRWRLAHHILGITPLALGSVASLIRSSATSV